MGLMKRLIKPEPLHEQYTEWKLCSVRLRKLLENARGLVSSIEDGKEKLQGEYIFDASYVTSLVEKGIEYSGMMVFDACVLFPEGGEKLYQIFDRQRKTARSRFLTPDALKAAARQPVEPDDEAEAEYRLLQSVMEWLGQKSTGESGTLLDLFRAVMDHVAQGLLLTNYPEKDIQKIVLETSGIQNRFTVLDLHNPVKGPPEKIGLADLNCPPLGVMLIGGKEHKADNNIPGKEIRNWFAVLEGEHLNLFRTEASGSLFWLCATLCGHKDADFIFLLERGRLWAADSFSGILTLEKSEESHFAWIYGVLSREIETRLMQVGSAWFALQAGENKQAVSA